MPIYRRKPQEIAAVQWDGTLAHADLLIAMFGEVLTKEVLEPVEGMPDRVFLHIVTPKEKAPVLPSDYLYMQNGYLCVQDAADFEANYALASQDAPPSLSLSVAVMEALAAGKRLHRAEWSPTERWIKLHQPPEAAEPCLYQKRDGHFTPWTPDESDRLAKWIEIEEKVLRSATEKAT